MAGKIGRIRIRRGLEANLPALAIGELAYTTDTTKFYIGGFAGNQAISGLGDALTGNPLSQFATGGSVDTSVTDRNGQVYNVLSYIPVNLWAGIRNGTNATPLQTYIQACIDAATGGAAGVAPSASRIGSRVYFPAGTYLITAPLNVVSVLGIIIEGASRHSAVILASGTFDSMFYLQGVGRSRITSMSFWGVGSYGGAHSVRTAIDVQWDSAVSQRPTESTTIENIAVIGLNFKYGIDLGSNSADRSVANIVLRDINIDGNRTNVSDSGVLLWQRGVSYGSGTGGNILNHYSDNVYVNYCRHAHYIDFVDSVAINYGGGGACQNFVYKNGNGTASISNLRVESTRHLVNSLGGASYTSNVDIENVTWAPLSQAGVEDQYVIIWKYSGTVTVRNFTSNLTAATSSNNNSYQQVYMEDAFGNPGTLVVDGWAAVMPVASLLVSTNSSKKFVKGYVQLDASLSVTTVTTQADDALQSGNATVTGSLHVTSAATIDGAIASAGFTNTAGLSTIKSFASTNTAGNIATLGARCDTTPAANFGSIITFALEDSTTNDVSAAQWTTYWNVATHNSVRGGVVVEIAGPSGMQEAWRAVAGGASINQAWFGATPQGRQTGDLASGIINLGFFSVISSLSLTPSAGNSGILNLGFDAVSAVMQVYPVSATAGTIIVGGRVMMYLYSTPSGLAGQAIAVGCNDNSAAGVFQASFASHFGLVARAFASRSTSAILQIQNSAGVSLGNVGGVIFDDYADTSTTHTDGTYDTLATHDIAANSLAVNGDKIRFRATLKMVGHAVSTDQAKCLFGGIEILDSGANNFANASTVDIFGVIQKVGGTTARATVTFRPDGSTTNQGYAKNQYTSASVLTGMTFTAANTLLIKAAATGTNSASGDVTLTMNTIEFVPAGV